MDKELIERLAKEAGMETAFLGVIDGGNLQRRKYAKFAALVADACAKAIAPGPPSIEWHGVDYHSNELANTIRAKFLMEGKP